MNISILVILAILVAIVLGYITKINTGLYAISFAFIIAVCVMGLKATQLINMWPTRIFLVIVFVSLFFGFAIHNGTMKLIADNIIFACRRVPFLIPYAIFLIGIVLSGMGAGAYAIIAFLVPLSMAIAEKTGMNRLLAALSAIFGSAVGACFVISMGGVMVKGFVESNGYPDSGAAFAWNNFWSGLIYNVIFITVAYVLLKGYKIKAIDIDKPEKANRIQKMNLWLIVGVALVMFLPLVIELIASNPVTKLMAAQFDITWIAAIGTVIALLLKIGDQKQVIASVPWNTIVLIGGVSVLIGVAIEAGTIDLLSSMVGSIQSKTLVIVTVVCAAGFMSFFSSTFGVVVPTLYPMVPIIAQASGVNPSILFTAIVLGAAATGVSPFSSAGSLALGAVFNDEHREKMYLQLLLMPLILLAGTVILSVLGIFVV